MKSKKIYFLASIGTLAIFAGFLNKPLQGAPQPSTAPIDKVLDMLEKKMLNQEDSEKSNSNEQIEYDKPSNQVTNSLKYSNPLKIQGTPAEQAVLNEIRQDIKTLEQRVDQISTGVSSLKQTLIMDSKYDAFVEIAARIAGNSQAQIRKIQIKLNDTILYDVSESSLLWNYSSDIPIYLGPLKAGSHRLQVYTRLALPNDNSLLKITGTYNVELNKVFDVHLPLGTSQNRFLIEIEPPQNEKSPATARLIEPN